MRSLGRRVRELRLAEKWTQNDLAMRLRTAVQRVQNIERGGENLTLFSLVRLANALEKPIETLFEKSVPLPETRPRSGRPRRSARSAPDETKSRSVRPSSPGKPVRKGVRSR